MLCSLRGCTTSILVCRRSATSTVLRMSPQFCHRTSSVCLMSTISGNRRWWAELSPTPVCMRRTCWHGVRRAHSFLDDPRFSEYQRTKANCDSVARDLLTDRVQSIIQYSSRLVITRFYGTHDVARHMAPSQHRALLDEQRHIARVEQPLGVYMCVVPLKIGHRSRPCFPLLSGVHLTSASRLQQVGL